MATGDRHGTGERSQSGGSLSPNTEWRVVRLDDFDFTFLDGPTIRSRNGREYIIGLSAFDIECTNYAPLENAYMYVWQWAFDDGQVVVGRTWEELDRLIRNIATYTVGKTLAVYVHNLSYEFQFLRTIYNFSQSEVFAVKSRRVLRATMYHGALEYRCSYLHSNMSLAEYTRKMGVKHVKQSGEDYNYDIVRYPWTPLTDDEMRYATYDVIGLLEALHVEMAADGDNVATIPLTSTGYVRRDTRRVMYKGPVMDVRKAFPDARVYTLLRQAFRGGNTHASRYYADRVVHDVKSADRSSSYPDVICNCKFPVSPFIWEGAHRIDEIRPRMGKEAFLLVVCFRNLRLRDIFWGAPYLSRDRCRDIQGGLYDNGRVLSADTLTTTITDVDYRIIESEYEYECVVLDSYSSKYGKLPRQLKGVNIDYYRKKTALKGVDGQEVYYVKAKNKLNSVYGMSAQDPAKQMTYFIDGEFVEGDEDIAALLAEAYKHSFLSYQWGVWVTAWARYRLEEGIRLAGPGFVYCDTDSVKYVGDVDWTAYNDERKADSLKNGAYAKDCKGKTHYMGVYEFEGVSEEFKTLGAKKYVYRQNGKLHITIAGVGKVKGAEELEKAGGVDAFRDGLVFRAAGGLDAKYNDVPPVEYLDIDGHRLRLGPNVYLSPSEYTVGLTEEYGNLIHICKRMLDIY